MKNVGFAGSKDTTLCFLLIIFNIKLLKSWNRSQSNNNSRRIEADFFLLNLFFFQVGKESLLRHINTCLYDSPESTARKEKKKKKKAPNPNGCVIEKKN